MDPNLNNGRSRFPTRNRSMTSIPSITESNVETPSLEELPPEIITHILTFTEPSSNVSQTSSTMRTLARKAYISNLKQLEIEYGKWHKNPNAIFEHGSLREIRMVVRELNFKQWGLIANLTNNREILNWLLTKEYGGKWILKSSVRNNYVDIFDRALQKYSFWPKISFYIGQYNNETLINRYHREKFFFILEFVKGAAKGGHQDIVILNEYQPNINWEKIVYYSAMKNNVNILDTARNNVTDIIYWNNVADGASRSGNIALLNQAISHGVTDLSKIIINAARGNRLDIIDRFLGDVDINGNDFTSYILFAAAQGGNKGLIKTLRHKYGIINWDAVAAGAGASGNLSILKLVLKNTTAISVKCVEQATKHGYAYIIKWYMVRLYSTNWHLIPFAAGRTGNLDVVKIAMSVLIKLRRNIASDIRTLLSPAVMNADSALLNYIIEITPPGIINWRSIRGSIRSLGYRNLIIPNYL